MHFLVKGLFAFREGSSIIVFFSSLDSLSLVTNEVTLIFHALCAKELAFEECCEIALMLQLTVDHATKERGVLIDETVIGRVFVGKTPKACRPPKTDVMLSISPCLIFPRTKEERTKTQGQTTKYQADSPNSLSALS
jgi:hypothetical protein